jgi:RNA polymerase sigma-70 factor (ECF subfamily)
MTALDGKALLQHGQSLACRYAGRIGREAAQDLGSEAVLRVVHSPAPDGRMEPWLERIFRNLLVDHWRRRKPAPVTIDDLLDLSGTGTPEEAALSEERRQLVRRALARLPHDLRRALLSRYYGGMSAEVAAGHLGIAPATVRTRIHRSLRRLRDMLAGLRALFPPVFAGMGAKAGGLALVPLVVVALVAVRIQPRPAARSDERPMVLAMERSHRAARVGSPRSQAPRSEASAPTVSDQPRVRTPPRSPKAAWESLPTTPAVKVIEFNPDDIDGDRLDPTGELIFVPAGVKYESLIEVPTSFPDAFEKMIEDQQ